MIAFLIVAAALFAAGTGAAYWGHQELDPEIAYIGVLLIAVALILAALVGCAWLYTRIT